MKKNLKSAASIALLSSLTFVSFTTLQPKPAHAVVGLATGNASVLVTGKTMSALGVLAFGIGAGTVFTRHESIGMILLSGTGMVVTVAGLILLDGGSVEFGHLSVSQAKRLGLSHAEWQSYEEELGEANALLEDQLQARKAEFEETGTVSIQNAMADWREAGASVSPLTFSAMKKIAASTLRM